MAFIEAQAVRAVLLIVLVAVVFTGVAFAGIAGFLALAPYLPAWSAAAIVALVLLVIALGAALIVRGRALPARTGRAEQAASSPDAAAIQAIAGMAQEKPLLAVVFAGLLGAAGTILQNKDRSN